MSKVARKKTQRCGAVETSYIERGWVCCACFKKTGVGTYNGKTREQCKQCGHQRCEGAMRRKWPTPKVRAVRPKREPVTFLGVFVSALSAIQRGAAISATMLRKETDDTAKWQAACDDVVAAFAAARLRADQAGREMPGTPVEVIAEKLRESLPRAVQIYQMGQHGPSCKCRHRSLIAARAEQLSKETGEDFNKLASSGMHVVEWYLSQRS